MADVNIYTLTKTGDDNTYHFRDDSKGKANGIASLDESGKVPSSQLPETPISQIQSDYAQADNTQVDYIKNKPTLGTAAGLDVASTGDATTTQVVKGDDSRLTDARNAADVYSWAKAENKPSYTASEVGLGNVDNTSDSTKKTNFTGSIASGNTGFVTGGDAYTAFTGKLSTALKGAANGLAELDSTGKVPSSQLPSYVDDVIEVDDYAHLPITGESGKIYVTKDTNKTYRWSGTGYVEISESLALGNTHNTAFYGDWGKDAYDHATETKLSTATASGLYKVAGTAQGHIASLTAVQKSDITALGIPGSDTNTTYTFAGGTNKFTVTPSDGGTPTTVTVTPSITNNITGSGTSGYLTKFNGTNTITNGPQLGSSTSTYLRNDGSWATPTDTNNRKSFYGTCDTAAGTAAKVVTLADTAGWELKAGTIVGVKFTNTNSASNVTLNVNGSGAKSIQYADAVYTGSSATCCGYANRVIYYMYDGSTYWIWLNAGYSLNSDTYDRNRYTGTIKCGSTAIVAGNIIVGKDGVFHHLKDGSAFDITYPILYANSAIAANATGNDNYDIRGVNITTTQSLTLTAYLPVYIKGTLSGVLFTPYQSACLIQTVPTTDDGYYYMYLGTATSTTTVYLQERHPIFTFIGGKFQETSINSGIRLSGTANATMTYASTNPQISFSDNGTQGVKILYTDYDSYRMPYGLKVIGDNSGGAAWFEVEGNIFCNNGKYNSYFTATPTSGQVVITDGTTGGTKSSGYTIAKSVPNNADFNDTKNTAGSTDTSSKIFLIGATSQAANPQTYSDNEVYVTSGTLQTKVTQASVTICANTANSGTAGGLSLYSTDPTNYGMMFRTTSNSGVHGYVTSDYAIYFTMSNTNNRGWVFRRNSSGNVASIDTNGRAVFNGSVTVGGNAANTSGARLEFNSNTNAIDFIFN